MITKVATPIRLPSTQAIADHGRSAIMMPAAISATPIKFEVAWTLKTAYSQDISGLLATSGSIAPAS